MELGYDFRMSPGWRICLLGLGMVLVPDQVWAQAWVPETQTLSVDVGYSFAFSRNHAFENRFSQIDPETGEETTLTEDGGLHSQIFHLAVDYTPVRNLGIHVALPLVMSRCLFDEDPEKNLCQEHLLQPGFENLHDGNYRAWLTDLITEVRYKLTLPGEILFTPEVGILIPTNDYPTLGHVAPGRGLLELSAGFSTARGFPDLLGLYTHFHYHFSYVGSPNTPCRGCLADAVSPEIQPHRSTMDLEFGVFPYEWLSFRALVNVIFTHDGVSYGDPNVFPTSVRPVIDQINTQIESPYRERRLDHDALRRERVVLIGGGVGVSPTPDLTVGLLYQQWVWGVNTHDTSALSLNLTWRVFSEAPVVGEYKNPFEEEFYEE